MGSFKKNGVSGIDIVTKVNKDDFPAKVAGEVKDWDPTQYMDKKKKPKEWTCLPNMQWLQRKMR